MKILWGKKLIKLSNGSYIAWSLKRKKFFFENKNELKLNCAIIEYYEERERCGEKVNTNLKKIIAGLEEAKANLEYLLEGRDNEIDELKRENRGIKTCANCDEYVIGRCCNYPNGVCHHWKLSEKYRNGDNLTKAKEILKGIVDTPMYNQMGGEMYENEEYKELIAEAEQFLKEQL